MPKCPTLGARYQEKLQNKPTPSVHDDRKETDQENHLCEPKYHSHTNHHTRNKRIPPERKWAARRIPRDVSARSPDRSARCFLDTADASPPNRSVSAPWQVSAAFVQLEPHRSAGRSARSARTAPDRCAAAAVFCGHSASSHSARKLGEAHACLFAMSWTARPCDRDRRQTGTDARPLDQVVVQLLCCSVSPFVVLPTLPSEPCLLGRTLSVTPE